MTTALYRHFDVSGALLYVGITGRDFTRRLHEHRCKEAWAKLVARTTVDYFPTRSEAIEAETRAIAEENPIHNRAASVGKVRSPRRTKVSQMDGALASFINADPSRTMADWSEFFGVSRSYLYGLMDGSRQPSIKVAKRISERTNGAVPVLCWENFAAVSKEIAA